MPLARRGSVDSIRSRCDTMSGCGENRSYGSVSQPGNARCSVPGSQKKRSSSSMRLAWRASAAMTSKGPDALRAASASHSEVAEP